MEDPGPEVAALDGVLSGLLKQSPDAMLAAFADDGTIMRVPAADALVGHPRIEIPVDPGDMSTLAVPDDRALVVTTWERALKLGMARATVRLLVAPERPVSLVFVDARHRYGVRLGLLIADDAVADQPERLFRRLTESLPLGVFRVDLERRIGYTNARLSRILGVPLATTLDEQFATVAAVDRPKLEVAIVATLEEGVDQQIEVGIILPDNGNRAADVNRRCIVRLAALSEREGVPGALVTVDDITEAARMREELRRRAGFDTLTGCHNRISTITALQQALAGDEPVVVVMVDLDGFKPVNDVLGHAAGDELLIHVAGLLFAVVRADDLVGRIGADEFLLICHGIPTGPEALDIGVRVQAALHHEVALDAGPVQLRAGVGIARFEPGLTAEDLVAGADAAMQESKRLGSVAPVLSSQP
jgi:diguanylate cyclase (GGDEF)-like protein/PAS domain S-box-containing protein